jgi:hypothetical protein
MLYFRHALKGVSMGSNIQVVFHKGDTVRYTVDIYMEASIFCSNIGN